MDLYVGSLYLPADLSSTAAVIDAPIAAIALILPLARSPEKCAMRSLKVLSTRPQKNTADIQPQIDAFMALFNEEIKEGDQFTFSRQ